MDNETKKSLDMTMIRDMMTETKKLVVVDGMSSSGLCLGVASYLTHLMI